MDVKTRLIETCAQMFTEALLIIAQRQKQPKCTSVDEWINKLWFIQLVEHYSSIKRMKYWYRIQRKWTCKYYVQWKKIWDHILCDFIYMKCLEKANP